MGSQKIGTRHTYTVIGNRCCFEGLDEEDDHTTTTATMATSMAATIAASLPAPQAASAPAAPTHEPIPASMAKLIDIEADIRTKYVQLEGLVCIRPVHVPYLNLTSTLIL